MKKKVILVLYCAENAEFACKEIKKPTILQERMFIAFEVLMLRVEKIVWAEDVQSILVCCGIILKAQEGPLEGSRLVFPFGKLPEHFWNPEKYKGWKISPADTEWDSILSPLINVCEVDGNIDNFTGED